jgi:hypothetical protein
VAPAGTAIAVAGLALLPLALWQRRPDGPNIDFISSIPLDERLRDAAHQFTKGTIAAPGAGLGLMAALAIVVGCVLLVRGERSERDAARLPLAIGFGGLALVILFDLAGFPVLLYRYLLPFWLPLAVVLAIGLASRRAEKVGVVAAVALAMAWVAINIGMFRDEGYHREDWRGVLAPLDPPPPDRMVAVSPGYADHVLFYYRRSGPIIRLGQRVREVAVVGSFAPDDPRFDVAQPPRRLPGAPSFRLLVSVRRRTLVILLYRAPRSERVGGHMVLPAGVGAGDAATRPLLQAPPGDAPEPTAR